MNDSEYMIIFKGSVSRDFQPLLFSRFDPTWAPDKQAKVFSNLVSIWPRYSQCCLPDVCCTQRRSKIFLRKPTFYTSNLFFHDRCVHNKRIYPDCPFKSNQGQVKITILTPQCAICLRGVLHTAEIISAVCCTPLRSSPWCVAHC